MCEHNEVMVVDETVIDEAAASEAHRSAVEPVISPPVFELNSNLIVMRSRNTTTGAALDDIFLRAADRIGLQWDARYGEDILDHEEDRNIFEFDRTEHGLFVLSALESLLQAKRHELVREELYRVTEKDGVKSIAYVENPNNRNPVTKADVLSQMVGELTMLIDPSHQGSN